MERVFTGRELVNTSSRHERNAAYVHTGNNIWTEWPLTEMFGKLDHVDHL